MKDPSHRGIDALMRPRSIAVLGASENAGHGKEVIRNLMRSGFAGPIYPINPRREHIYGIKSYNSLAEVPQIPDCVIYAIAAPNVLKEFEQAVEMGVPAAVVVGAGFAELDESGAWLEHELSAMAKQAGVSVCGPNCLGLVNLVDGVPLYAADLGDLANLRGNVGLIAQSGSVSYSVAMTGRVGWSYVISMGNQAVTDAADFTDFLVDDKSTRAIGIFVEAVPEPQKFADAIVRADEANKQVVVCKTGRSQRGAETALAHTGRIAGSWESFAAFCRSAGAVVVDDLEEMLEVLDVISAWPHHPDSSSIALVNCSGGENGLINDIADSLGLKFATLTEPTIHSLRQALPAFAHVSNPLDVTGATLYNHRAYEKAIRALATDPSVGVLIVVQDLPRLLPPEDSSILTGVWTIAGDIAAADSNARVVAMTNVSGGVPAELRRQLHMQGVGTVEGTRRGLTALARLLGALEDKSARVTRFGQALEINELVAARELLHRQHPRSEWVPESLILDVLSAAGIPVVSNLIASSRESAVEAAKAVGYPVVAKIVAEGVVHKAELGGVRLSVANDDDVGVAWDELTGLGPDVGTGESVRRLAIQPMVDVAAELFLGMKTDEGYGPTILVGLGGSLVEAGYPVAGRQAPVLPEQGLRMLEESGLMDLIRAISTEPTATAQQAALVISRFSMLCLKLMDIVKEVDVNPLAVDRKGRVIALDGAMRRRSAEE